MSLWERSRHICWSRIPHKYRIGPLSIIRARNCSRGINSNSNESTYIDEWFQSILKPQTFYDEHSSGGDIRRYFYNIDLQGRLFLEETLPKNIATSIKDEKFLNFFFSRIRWANSNEVNFLEGIGSSNEYPFVSPCGKEINFIRPAATPIVFHSIVDQDFLVYGGNLKQSFCGDSLAVSETTGRLYHKFLKTGNKSMEASDLGYGLIRSSVAVSLSEKITAGSDDSGSHLEFHTQDGPKPIRWLPDDAEPGAWSLPADVDEN